MSQRIFSIKSDHHIRYQIVKKKVIGDIFKVEERCSILDANVACVSR